MTSFLYVFTLKEVPNTSIWKSFTMTLKGQSGLLATSKKASPDRCTSRCSVSLTSYLMVVAPFSCTFVPSGNMISDLLPGFTLAVIICCELGVSNKEYMPKEEVTSRAMTAAYFAN